MLGGAANLMGLQSFLGDFRVREKRNLRCLHRNTTAPNGSKPFPFCAPLHANVDPTSGDRSPTLRRDAASRFDSNQPADLFRRAPTSRGAAVYRTVPR